MRPERYIVLTPRMEKAVNELKGTISERFPQASFVVEEGFDPKGIYLVTTVDIADTDGVIDAQESVYGRRSCIGSRAR